jgi:hypothetical protein
LYRVKRKYPLTQINEPLTQAAETDRPDHTLCALSGALGLLAGRNIRVPRRAYPGPSPSRLARLLQILNGASSLLLSAGRRKTLVSGDHLDYLYGKLQYTTEPGFRSWWRCIAKKRPFFVVSDSDPAESIAAITGCDANPEPQLLLSVQRCVLVIMANWSATAAVLHYADCSPGIAELERQANGLTLASSCREIHPLIPQLLAHSALSNGAAVLAQSRISAQTHEFSWLHVDAALELWRSRSPAGGNAGSIWIEKRLDRIAELLPRHRNSLLPAMDALLDWCRTAHLRGELAHGDFWLGNVLFNGDAIAGLIDWEWAHTEGYRVVDALYMVLMSCAVANDVSIADYLCQLWSGEIEDDAMEERIARLGVASGMDRDDLKFVALLLWFDLLWQRTVRGGMPSVAWSEKMIPRTLPAVMKWLNQYTNARGIRAITA